MVLMFVLAACSSGGTGATGGPTDGGDETVEPSAAGSESATDEESAAAEPEAASLMIGLSQPIFSFTPVYVMDAKGLCEEENLDIELTVFNSGTENQQAIVGNAIDIGAGGYTEPITLTAQGTPTPIIGFIQSALPYRLMVDPEITDVEQLSGKVFAVSKIGALSDQITRIALNQAGVDPDSVSYQQAGGSPSRLAALQSGAVDGALLDSPSYQLAEEDGFNPLINVAADLPGFPYEVLYATQEAIDAQPDVYVRFMRCYISAAEFATDPANQEEVLQIVSDATGQETADLQLAYEETISDFPPTGEISLDGIQQALEGTQQYGDLPGADELTAEDIYYPDLQEEAAGSPG